MRYAPHYFCFWPYRMSFSPGISDSCPFSRSLHLRSQGQAEAEVCQQREFGSSFSSGAGLLLVQLCGTRAVGPHPPSNLTCGP